MNKPELTNEKVENVFDTRFLKVFGLEYIEGRQYMTATRRTREELVALKKGKAFEEMLPDAVSCVVILNGQEPRLLLTYEFRYPLGQYILSVPAGLIDPDDKEKAEPIIETAIRELKEEANIELGDKDRIEIINPVLFSTPGMTDESNALVCVVIDESNQQNLNHDGCEGTELFEDFEMLTKDEALRILKQGRDDKGIYYSMYTWAGLMYFVSDMWK